MKVLLAVDGSGYSNMCVSAAKSIGLPSDSEITVLTVVPEHAFLGGLHLDRLWANGEHGRKLHKAREESAQDIIDKTVSELKTARAEINTTIVWGNPEEQIINAANQTQTDLVIIGAKGLVNADRFHLGTVAYGVIKHAHCSVLVVKEDIQKVRRILLATDGSEHSCAAEDFLLGLSLPRKIDIFLVIALQSHVAAYLKMPTLSLETNQQILSELQKAEGEKATELLNRTEAKFKEKNYEVTPLLRQGEPSQEILNCANAFNPEIVAVGAKGLSGIESFLLGSVAQRVARFSRYSVLVVRPKKNEKG